jgi:RimJ/RimL family protein N-acetyltransferase
MLVRLGQEVQEVPRGVARLGADPQLADDRIRLQPLSQDDVPDMFGLVDDPDVMRFTRVPAGADEEFVSWWIGRYESGWQEGTRAGFAVRDHDGAFLGFAAVVDLDLEHHEGELGYMIVPAARGRGAALPALELLNSWCFDDLGLIRAELRIDVANTPSLRIAERAGYRQEGVLRNVHVKDELRCDLSIWSRLASD